MTVGERTALPRRRAFGAAAWAVAFATALGMLSPATAAVSAQTETGSIGVRLVDIPASAADDSRARQYIVDHLQPGTTVERRFEISNSTAAAVAVDVYASAASITLGTFLGDEGRSANELSSRTTIGEPAVVVAANDSVMNTVSIDIPQDAAPGEQYAAIWVEARSSGTGAVEVVNRVGIRMYVSVGGSNPPASSLSIDSLAAGRDSDGAPLVTATIRNTGGRALDASATLGLVKTGGTLAAGPYSSDEGITIAPGESGELVVPVGDDIDDGPWNASIAVSSGPVEEQSEAEIVFPAQGRGQDVPTTAPADNLPFLIAVILAIVLALALVTIVIRSRIRSRRRLGFAPNATRDEDATQEGAAHRSPE